jgi:hypothetical protein
MKSGDDNFQSARTHPEDGNCSVWNNVEQLSTFDSSYTPNTEFYIEHQLRKPENKNIKNKLSIGFYRHGNFRSQPSKSVCVCVCVSASNYSLNNDDKENLFLTVGELYRHETSNEHDIVGVWLRKS